MCNAAAPMIIKGQKIDLFNLSATPQILDVSGIATSLYNIIRFNGNSGYSVGAHSLMLSYIVENVIIQLFNEFSNKRINISTELLALLPEISEFKENLTGKEFIRAVARHYALNALVHDFGEALTGDIIRPLKSLIPEISVIEKKIDDQIRRHFNLAGDLPLLVDLLDKQIATIEAYYLTIYYDKPLIDLSSVEQFELFNQPFSNAYTSILGKITKVQPRLSDSIEYSSSIQTPLNPDEILGFLNLSHQSLEMLKSLNEADFIALFLKRFNELSN